MIELNPVSTVQRALLLEPRVERGNHGPLEPLPGVITVGGPVSIPLTSDRLKDDSELANFVAADGAYRYDLVHLAATFEPSEDEPLDRAWIQISLSRFDGGAPPLPIAWSMKPDRVEDEGSRSTGIKLGGSVKIADVGIEAGVDRSNTHVMRDVRIEALHELQSTPTWVLHRTKGSPIRGNQRFVLVLRTPRQTLAAGVLELGATVHRRRFGILSHRAVLKDTPQPIRFIIDDRPSGAHEP